MIIDKKTQLIVDKTWSNFNDEQQNPNQEHNSNQQPSEAQQPSHDQQQDSGQQPYPYQQPHAEPPALQPVTL